MYWLLSSVLIIFQRKKDKADGMMFFKVSQMPLAPYTKLNSWLFG